MSPPCQYSSIPHLQNSVFSKHLEYFKYLKALFLIRSFKIRTLQFPLKVLKIDPLFYVFMSHEYWGLCYFYCAFTEVQRCALLRKADATILLWPVNIMLLFCHVDMLGSIQ